MGHKRVDEAIEAATKSAEAAKTEAERASEAKDYFLAMLSHELCTPLTPVVATLSILQQQDKFDPETRQYLEVIRRNVELEIRLINDLLDLTRINRGKIELEKKPVELSAIVNHAVEVCRADIEARHISCQVDILEPPYFVHGDAMRLQQMFWNIIKNAVKFTPAGGNVRISAWRENGEMVVEVKDNGVGIEAAALGSVFNAFEQVNRTVTQQFGGLGMGLAISKAMAELHEGSIKAHSDGKNLGATFTVRLPALSPAQIPSQPSLAKESRAANPGPLKILLVEDHKDSAEMLRLLLTKQGYEVQTAGNIATALDAARQNEFDLIVSDLSLPDGNGAEIMRQLRARGQIIPAIALSGYGREQDVQKSLQAGFAAHLLKPVNLDQLTKTITAVVSQAVAECLP